MKDFILILGPQSSGKSTQGKLLAEHLGYKFVSSGQVLRDLGERDNPVGAKLKEYWVSGELVPDELIEEILFPIFENENYPGFIIDGYPRNIGQLNSFLSFLGINDWAIGKIFYVHVGEEECLKRLKLRSDIEKRPDEHEEAVRKRFQIYHNLTEPLLIEYERMGKLLKIDGERSIEDIQNDLKGYFIS